TTKCENQVKSPERFLLQSKIIIDAELSVFQIKFHFQKFPELTFAADIWQIRTFSGSKTS
ncbi:MAG: hypothetical protein ABIQ40_20040, partial [Bacteroidia bacterium]